MPISLHSNPDGSVSQYTFTHGKPTIGEGVTLGNDVTFFKGGVVGAGSFIGHNVRLTAARLGLNCRILDKARVVGALPDDAVIAASASYLSSEESPAPKSVKLAERVYAQITIPVETLELVLDEGSILDVRRAAGKVSLGKGADIFAPSIQNLTIPPLVTFRDGCALDEHDLLLRLPSVDGLYQTFHIRNGKADPILKRAEFDPSVFLLLGAVLDLQQKLSSMEGRLKPGGVQVRLGTLEEQMAQVMARVGM